jgi:outer membrane receptor protein involved in Fe transport
MDERRGGPLLDDYITLDAFHRVDAFVQYAFRPRGPGRASLSLNVENLLNERYFRPGPIVENPVNAKMTLRYTF